MTIPEIAKKVSKPEEYVREVVKSYQQYLNEQIIYKGGRQRL